MSAEHPSVLIEDTFAAIAAGAMRDVPLNNPALRVEAVGVIRWEDLWLGVLVTPWAINLMLMPAGNPAFRVLQGVETQCWRFPSGAYEFLGGFQETLGPYQTCSLFSPPAEFSHQDQARQVAVEVLAALFREEDGDAIQRREAARLEGRAVRYSRRAFLLGGLGKT